MADTRVIGYDPERAEAVRQATLEGMHARLAAQVASLDSQQAWMSWLRFARSFHQYSFNNVLLIQAQRPDATAVAGYRAWQARGRQVMKGETAIRVLGPVTRRTPKLDARGEPVLGADGKVVFEARIVGVKPVSVFDVLQTTGEPLPTPPDVTLLVGEAPVGLWDALADFVDGQGYRVTRGDCGRANGVTLFDEKEVRVRADVDDAQAVKTLAHEAAHVLLHAVADVRGSGCRGVLEVEAESVGFIVCQAHGLDASQYTFNYVAGWAHAATSPDGPTLERVLLTTGQRVIGAADRILQHTQPQAIAIGEDAGDPGVPVASGVNHGAPSEPVPTEPGASQPTSDPELAWSQVPASRRSRTSRLDGASIARRTPPRSDPEPAGFRR